MDLTKTLNYDIWSNILTSVENINIENNVILRGRRPYYSINNKRKVFKKYSNLNTRLNLAITNQINTISISSHLNTDLKVGDIAFFVDRSVYLSNKIEEDDSNRINFYKVTKMNKASIRLQPIKFRVTDSRKITTYDRHYPEALVEYGLSKEKAYKGTELHQDGYYYSIGTNKIVKVVPEENEPVGKNVTSRVDAVIRKNGGTDIYYLPDKQTGRIYYKKTKLVYKYDPSQEYWIFDNNSKQVYDYFYAQYVKTPIINNYDELFESGPATLTESKGSPSTFYQFTSGMYKFLNERNIEHPEYETEREYSFRRRPV